MRRLILIAGVRVALSVLALPALAQTPPPAPSPIAPAPSAAVVQPIRLEWSAVVDPDGPIGSYTWQVSTSSTFAFIIASGFTNDPGDNIVPIATHDFVSGLPNGTYFWRVKATQIVGGAVFSLDSAWSPARTFTVIGLGAGPGTPSFIAPANGAQFHVREFFRIRWTAVPGAHHYILEADAEATFSHPFTLTTDPLQFGTSFRAGWGNPLDIFYRITAVSPTGVRGLPSSILSVHITNAAPVSPPPTLLSPIGGATVTPPFRLDWSDTADPLVAAYDVDIDDEPNFLGVVGVLLVQGVSRSDYMVVPDPLVEGINHFPPGTYFWRVRALHGDVFGPWSAGQSFTVAPMPPTPPGLSIFHILNEPGSVSGGNSTQARVTLNMAAPPGGALVQLATDFPHAQVPASVVVPEGKTDATVAPITSIPVPGATVGSVRAAYGIGWQDNSLGLWPILWDIALNAESVVGGSSVVGTVTLLNPAPPGGVEVALVNNDPDLISIPATIVVPSGGTGATFNVVTASVSVPARATIGAGTAFEGYRAPGSSLTLMPAGSPAPPPSLSSLTLASASVLGESTTTGTVALTSPAPSGGALVRLNGSMEGQVLTPQNVMVPAGSISANFPVTAPQVNAPRYVLVQATYGTSGGTHARLLEVDPAPPGAPTLFAFGAAPTGLIGGASTRGTVSLVMVAPPGGGAVTLTSDNPSVVQVPPTVSIPAGNSANSFTITTSPVTLGTTVRVDAAAGGVTKSQFLNVAPDPNTTPLLSSVTLAAASVAGGSSVSGTVFLSGPAPSGGASVTLSTSNLVARPQPVVTVTAGLSAATFTVTTTSVTSSTPVTITAILGTATRTASLTVTPGGPSPTPGTPSLLIPADRATVAQPVTFDWSDVANAASYLIQISTSNNFSPITASKTSAASQATIGGLPAQQLFWRVRAVNSAGVAGTFSAVRRFTAQSAPAAPTLSGVSLNPSSVVGGSPSQGTVTLTAGAPPGGAAVSLASANTAVATVPASVTIAAGATSATIPIATSAVSVSASSTISATFAGVARSATLTVTPVPAAPTLSTLSVSPTSVTGGAASTGTVTLTSAATGSGAVVTLVSSNSSAAGVPASVTVAPGASSAPFTITTSAVTTTTPVTISGTLGVTRSATLTVNPQAPTQSATLTVTATGRNGERVTSSPAGMNVAVGSTGSATFTIGTSITLSVTNGRDAIWSGACSSEGNKTKTCTFTITGNSTVNANVQ